MRNGRRFVAVLGLTGSLLAGAGIGTAYALYTADGTGTASFTVSGPPVSVHVEAVASGSPTNLLLPGVAGDLLVQLLNPNPYSVTVVAIAQNGPVTVSGGGVGCTSDSGTEPSLNLGTSGVSVSSQSGLTISVASNATNGGVHVVAIPNGATMALTAASACQGATFQIPVTLTVER